MVVSDDVVEDGGVVDDDGEGYFSVTMEEFPLYLLIRLEQGKIRLQAGIHCEG